MCSAQNGCHWTLTGPDRKWSKLRAQNQEGRCPGRGSRSGNQSVVRVGDRQAGTGGQEGKWRPDHGDAWMAGPRLLCGKVGWLLWARPGGGSTETEHVGCTAL